MLVPNIKRVLIKPIKAQGVTLSSGIVIAGQLKAGERLFLGEVIHPGDTQFKKGQKIYYSEYSASQVADWGVFYRSGGKETAPEYVIVAQDDIMGYDDEGFSIDEKVSEEARKAIEKRESEMAEAEQQKEKIKEKVLDRLQDKAEGKMKWEGGKQIIGTGK